MSLLKGFETRNNSFFNDKKKSYLKLSAKTAFMHILTLLRKVIIKKSQTLSKIRIYITIVNEKMNNNFFGQ